MDLDTRRLRVFLVVAEELHFSRAAARLHLSQPALSQQIRLLERSLGVTLFERTSRQVELTAAGEALQQAAPRVRYELDRAVEATHQAARGITGRVSIGSVRTGLARILPELMREFSVDHPEVRYDILHMDTSLQLRALADRSIDIGIVRAASATERIAIEPLASEPLMVALPADHPLAAADPIDPAELAHEQFVSWPRHLGADFSDIVVAFCREHGFSPSVVSEGDDIDTQLALVAAGFGVSLQPAFYASASPVGVVFCSLDGPTPRVDLQLAWRQESLKPVVAQLIETARRLRDR